MSVTDVRTYPADARAERAGGRHRRRRYPGGRTFGREGRVQSTSSAAPLCEHSSVARPAERNPDVIVVGAGAVGLACALYAQRRGLSVEVLDAGGVGQGASFGNAGLVPPSSTTPLAGPGAIPAALRWLLDPDGAFRLHPRPSSALARWLLEFRRQCSAQAARRVSELLLPLVQRSLLLFEELAAEGLEFDLARDGTLVLCASKSDLAHVAESGGLLDLAGVEHRTLDPAGLVALEPMVGAGIAGGVHYPGDAHLHPGKFTAALAERVRKEGGTITTAVRVEGFAQSGAEIVGLRTSTGRRLAGQVVLAAGWQASALARDIGLELLIEPAKGYHLEFDGVPAPRLPLRLLAAKSVVTGVGGSLRITSKLELTAKRGVPERRIVRGVPRLALRHLRLDALPRPTRTWYGFRPLTPDYLPYLGRPQELRNVVLATGHGQLGVALAPVTGWLVAGLLAGAPESVSMEPFAAERFARRSGGSHA